MRVTQSKWGRLPLAGAVALCLFAIACATPARAQNVVFTGLNNECQGAPSDWTHLTAIAAGEGYTVGLKRDGTVVAQGANSAGQCNVSDWRHITAISASSHTVGLRSNGTVVAAGSNYQGACDISSWRHIVAIGAGGNRTVGVKRDGTVVVAGFLHSTERSILSWQDITAVAVNTWHIVGLRADGTVVVAGPDNWGENNVSSWQGIVAIAAGSSHTVGLKADGTVVAVGRNADWDGTYVGQCNVSGWTGITAIAADRCHTVGLKADGTVVATGLNSDGQCNVSAWAGIAAVAASGNHTVGLKGDGTAVGVGFNASSQCNLRDWWGVTSFTAGGSNTVGVKGDGTVVAIGSNYFGQCEVADWTGIAAVAAGSNHTVGLRDDGTVVAVGQNDVGQCNVSGWTGITAISAGSNHTLGLKADGTVVATGSNTYWTGEYMGQCDLSDWTGITAIAAGNYNSVGLKADGTVVARGWNEFGQLDVSGWTGITAISCGGGTTVGLKGDGTVVAVGYDLDPRCDVSGWTGITAIAAGGNHTVGLKSAGTGVAVGLSENGSCDVSDWTGIVAISAGGQHTIGLGAWEEPTALQFTANPSGADALQPLPPIQVVDKDDAGTTVPVGVNTVTVTLGANPAGARLLGTTSVEVVNGVATFSDLKVDKPGAGYTLVASSTWLRSATSAAFSIGGPPAKLAFLVQPASTPDNTFLSPAVQVAVCDAAGNLVPDATNYVTLDVAAGPARGGQYGLVSVNAVNGVATFSEYRMNRPGTYYLRATAPGLTSATSAPIVITVRPADALKFWGPVANATAGATLATVSVALMTEAGAMTAAAEGTVTLALAENPAGAVLLGTTTVNTVSSMARFRNLRISKAGTGYTLIATCAGLPAVTSNAFNVSAAAPVRLVLTEQPTNTAAGAVISPAVKAELRDRFGNVCTGATNAVTVAIPAGYAGTLGGTTTRNPVDGVVTFDDLAVYRSGHSWGNYRLSVTAAGLTGTTSASFKVTGIAAAP